jgi:hypothetical protein
MLSSISSDEYILSHCTWSTTTPWILEKTKRGGKQVKEHLVNYILYINNILVKVKLIELIELKVEYMWAGSWGWERGYEVPR